MLLLYLFKASILALIVLPCFSRIGEGREIKRTSSTIDLGAAFKIGVKTGLNRRESMLRKTLEESSLVLASLKSKSELEFIYIQLILLVVTHVTTAHDHAKEQPCILPLQATSTSENQASINQQRIRIATQ
jgi:hypothetical protein